jgi:hypothetical protein
MSETVNSPAHYTSGSIECIDAIDDAVADLTGQEGYYIGNIRWKKKNGVEDLRKAQRYLTRLINLLEGGKGWGKCTNVQLDRGPEAENQSTNGSGD